eukprot:356735-Chlamydomonas_euryale.AAC.8
MAEAVGFRTGRSEHTAGVWTGRGSVRGGMFRAEKNPGCGRAERGETWACTERSLEGISLCGNAIKRRPPSSGHRTRIRRLAVQLVLVLILRSERRAAAVFVACYTIVAEKVVEASTP